jgi:hypothetical protein
MERNTILCPTGLSTGSGTFLLYINDLPKIISEISKPILFADDTSIIISDKDPINFKIKINKVSDMTNEWFATNLLSINYEKTCFFYSFKLKIVKCWIFRLVI